VTTTEWLMGGDTGISSMAIFAVMTGTRYHPPGGTPIPYDPDDFGRCHRLLERFPAWRLRLGEVPAVYPAWTPFVPAWDELTALYVEELPSGRCPKLYARLSELRDAAYEADGWVRTGPNGWKKTALAAWKASPDAELQEARDA